MLFPSAPASLRDAVHTQTPLHNLVSPSPTRTSLLFMELINKSFQRHLALVQELKYTKKEKVKSNISPSWPPLPRLTNQYRCGMKAGAMRRRSEAETLSLHLKGFSWKHALCREFSHSSQTFVIQQQQPLGCRLHKDAVCKVKHRERFN